MMNISKIFSTFLDNIKEVSKIPSTIVELFKNPIYLLGMVGIIILLVLLFHARKIKLTPQILARMGLIIALTFLLHALKIYEFPNGGGSVTIGSFIPIMILSYMYGPEIGMLTGFVYGTLHLIMGGYMINPIQVIFDYPLPFMCLGLAGFCKNNKYLGALLAVFFKFVCHFISGVAFFGSYAPKGMSPWLYSLSVNGILQGVECAICLVILAILPVERIIKEVNRNTSVAKA